MKEDGIHSLFYCLLVLKAQRLAFNLAINEYLPGMSLWREGTLPTGNHSHIPQLLEIKGFLPTAHGTGIGAVSGGKHLLLATVITVSWRLVKTYLGALKWSG